MAVPTTLSLRPALARDILENGLAGAKYVDALMVVVPEGGMFAFLLRPVQLIMKVNRVLTPPTWKLWQSLEGGEHDNGSRHFPMLNSSAQALLI
jgi:hypothetical protein